MATMTVWKFHDPSAAQRAEDRLIGLSKQELIHLYDAAVVEWYPGKKRPKTRQAHNLVAAGALGGAFWGALFGLIFFIPLLGLALGAAAGAMSGSLADVGIDDDFIDSVKSQVVPGTSALFVMSSDAVLDKVKDAFSDMEMELIQTNLSNDQEAALREVFAEEE